MFRPGLDHTIFKSKFSFISSIVSLGCQSNQIVSGDACTECDAGQIPNHAKDACKKCPPNEITKDGVVCEKCKGLQVPNNDQTECLDTGLVSIFNFCDCSYSCLFCYIFVTSSYWDKNSILI